MLTIGKPVKTMRKVAQAKSREEFDTAKNRFLALADYKDSEQMAKRCGENIEQLKQEYEQRRIAKENAEKAQKAKKTRIGIITVLAVVLAVAAYFTYTKVIIPPGQYKAAEVLFEEGRYEDAWRAFKALGNYKDSVARAEETAKAHSYAGAEELLEIGEYKQASIVFESLGSYLDSATRAKEAVYASAEALLAQGDNISAAIAFGKFGDYKDARERSFALWNELAQRDTIAAGDYHTVGLKKDGTIVAAGENTNGQCDVSGWTEIVAVAAGGSHTVGLKADGTVVAVGYNKYGQCNISGWTDIKLPYIRSQA